MVKRGSLIAGRKQLAKDLGLTEQMIRTSLMKLKSTNEITIESTNRYSVITVVKYDDYQNDSRFNNQPNKDNSNQQATNKQPTSNQQATTTNKVNKVNKVNIYSAKPNRFLNYAQRDYDFDEIERLLMHKRLNE